MDQLTGLNGLTAVLSDVACGLTAVLEEPREISHAIHPATLSSGGLRAALKTLARRSTLPVTLDIAIAADLPKTVEVAAYYITAEALANAAKHAQASEVMVRAVTVDDKLYLSIRDDGIGGADSRKGSGSSGSKTALTRWAARGLSTVPREAGR
jgi:signal transduction histidine kinase